MRCVLCFFALEKGIVSTTETIRKRGRNEAKDGNLRNEKNMDEMKENMDEMKEKD